MSNKALQRIDTAYIEYIRAISPDNESIHIAAKSLLERSAEINRYNQRTDKE